MPSYSIHAHATLPLKAVKRGWSWPAFLFGGVWAVFSQLWLVVGALIVFLIVWTVLTAVSHRFDLYMHPWLPLLNTLMALVFGGLGNDLIRDQLRRLGYRCVSEDTAAPTPAQALSLYAESHGTPAKPLPETFVAPDASPLEHDADALGVPGPSTPWEPLPVTATSTVRSPLPRAQATGRSRAWALAIGLGVALAIWALVRLIGAAPAP